MITIPLTPADADIIRALSVTRLPEKGNTHKVWDAWIMSHAITYTENTDAYDELATALLDYANEMRDAAIHLGAQFSDAKVVLFTQMQEALYLNGCMVQYMRDIKQEVEQ